MSQQINIQDSVTLVPSGYDSANSSYSGVNTSYPISNGYTDSSSTSYAYITCNTGSRAESHISYTFDVSNVPENATITSVTCSAKTRVSSTSYLTASTIQLYSGSNAKGSSVSAASTSATARNITSTGTWTRSELNNIQIRLTGTRGTSNTTRAAYLYFYGATLTINYSITGTQYTLTATSEVNGVTITPVAATAMDGDGSEVEFTIELGNKDITDIIVEDNGVDVTNLLVEEQDESGGSISAVPGSSVTTGFSDSGGAFYQSSSTTSDSWLRYAIGNSAEDPYSTSNTSNTYVKGDASGNTTTGWMNFPFDFSGIPANAIIESVEVKVYGARENATVDSTHVCHVGLYSGSTLKSTQQNLTSTSNGIVTITNPGTWTRAELQNAQLRFTIGYYGGRILGATWTVEYSIPTTGTHYIYTLSDIDDDHEIVITEAGAFIPPEEDPQKTYYPITISSINAATNPANGTTRVESGTTQVITITPDDPQLTLALDNGVDITSQLVGGTPTNTYEVDTQATGASYGFNLNSSTGYYVSTNNGTGSSASVARVTFDLESNVLVTIQYINQGESQCDYGMFGKIDTTVSTTGNTYASSSASPDDPNNYYYMCAAAADSTTTVKTLTYEIPMGEHFIDIKYAKDQASDSGNDSLQWKILSVEATSAGGEYTYTLTNINQRHSLIFIFGDVSYYFITSSGSNCKLFPDGQLVVLEGNSYHITIVPDNPDATVTLTDNNRDVTSSLEFVEGTDKNNNRIVNYIYNLSNITATHTLVATCSSGTNVLIYLKLDNRWGQYSKVWKKVNDTWVEQNQSSWSTVLPTGSNYRLIEV